MWDRWKEASITKTSLRQTDRQTDSIYRASTASRGDKNSLIVSALHWPKKTSSWASAVDREPQCTTIDSAHVSIHYARRPGTRGTHGRWARPPPLINGHAQMDATAADGWTSNAQITPPARQDKTVLSALCHAVWTESRGRLEKTRSRMDSQWSSRNTGEIWSLRRVPVISRAVSFCTDCSLRSRVSGIHRRAANCNNPTGAMLQYAVT